MKAVKLNINAKTPVPPAVDVTKFEPKPEQMGALRSDFANETPLPPAPPQINAPVGLPPPPVEVPSDFDGFLSTALKVRGGRLDMAQFWAVCAQAAATKLVADRFEELLVFVGAKIEVDEDRPQLQDQIASGILTAAAEVKDMFGEVVLADVMGDLRVPNGVKSE